MFSRRTALLLLAILVIVPAATAQGPDLIAGPNVNMVSGTVWPDGDPFLQRQNEPSVAVSTRNPLHLMAASNDYRTVDLPGPSEGLPIADSWIGVYTSLDGGGSWTSTLLPGYPLDQTPEGVSSPVHGFQAAADPVMRAGTHGMFYLSGIVFDRGVTPQTKLFVARYVDLNNDPGNPIQYIDNVEVVSYDFPSNIFIDKPWLAVDVPNSGAYTKTFAVNQIGNPASPVSQAVECGNLYLAWSEIESVGDTVVESHIKASISTDCGETWSPPQELTDPGTINQGATVAVSPNPGNVYVAWRQLTGLGVTGDCGRGPGYWKNHIEDWPYTSLVLGAETYDHDDLLAILNKSGKFRKNDITCTLARQLVASKFSRLDIVDPAVAATMALADAYLVMHPVGSNPKKDAKTEGGLLATELKYYNLGVLGPIVCGSAPASDDAIFVAAKGPTDSTFGAPTLVRALEPFEPFDQGMTEDSFRTTAYPTMTVDADGRIYIAWSERGEALPTADPDPVVGDSRIMVATLSYAVGAFNELSLNPIDQPEVPGHQIQPTITFINDHLFLVYNDFREDYSGIFDRFVMDVVYRHTVDIRAAVAYPGDVPEFTDYLNLSPSTQVSRYFFIPTLYGGPGPVIFEQLDFNPPNLRMFKGGTRPFYGDYIDIAGAPPFIPDGLGWTYNTSSAVEPIAHAVWTDNRNVVGPPDGDWTSFVPLGLGGPSKFDPGINVAPCNPGSDDVDRTRMRNQDIYTSRLTTGLYVAVPGNSRPLGYSPGTNDLFQRAFVIFAQNGTAENKFFRLEIQPSQQPLAGLASFDQFSPAAYEDVEIEANSSVSRAVFVKAPDPTASIEVLVIEIDAIGGSVVVGGLQSSVVINPDPTNPGPADTSLLTNEIYAPAVFNPAVYNPAVYNPAVFNPAVFNPAVFNPAVLNWDVDNPAVYNPAVLNPAVFNPAVFNPAVFNQAMMSLALMNPAVFNPAVFNPAVFNPAVFNPAVFNPAVLNPAVLNPAVFNPAVFNPAVLNPAVFNPAVFNTSLEERSFTDFNYVAENHGNATTAYSVNLNLDNPPDGVLYQLMVYRIYFTPAANDCELVEAAQQEILVNNNDPNVNGNLNDSQSGDTFYLDPGDYAVITLRVIPDPNGQPPVDPETVDDYIDDNLDISVVSCCVDKDKADDGETQPSGYVIGPDDVSIFTASLPGGNLANPYTSTLLATGGSGSYTWTLKPGEGTLPDGLGLSTAGVISGTPTTMGTFIFTVQVTDGTYSAEKTLNIPVAPAAGGPVFFVQPTTATAGTPIPDFSVIVLDGDGLAWPGVEVTLGIGSFECSSGALVPAAPSALTDSKGIASFSGISIDRGGVGYTLNAVADIVPAPVTTGSDPFGLVGFCETASMGAGRVGATVTRLADGRILAAGGVTQADGATSPLASAEIYDPTTGLWTLTTGSLITARSLHTATLLADGRVLIAGGSSSYLPAVGPALNSAEFFDPAGGGSFSSAGTLTVARMAHTATLLSDGRVLIAGGRSGATISPYLVSGEIFDAVGSTFTAITDPMTTGRDSHRAVRLIDGRVLLVGGLSAALPAPYLNSADIFDPAGLGGAGDFTATDNMTEARINHTATLLDDGRVVVAGGNDGSGTLASAEIYDPLIGGGTFSLSFSMSTSRERHTAARILNGAVLLAGGFVSSPPFEFLLESSEIFDPMAGTFTVTHDMITARQLHLTMELPDGRVLAAGGTTLAGAGISAAETFWAGAAKILWARQFGTTTLDAPKDISVDASGVYAVGETYGTLPGQTSSGEWDAYVRKYDLAGKELTTHQFGTAGNENANDVFVDTSGVYVAGSTSGAFPGHTNLGGTDAYVRKYDFAGNEIWTDQFGTGQTDDSYAISVDATGVYVAGRTQGTLPGQTSSGGWDVFVRKYNITGTVLWTRQFGSIAPATDLAEAISVDASGVYVAGHEYGTLPGQTSLGGRDAFVRKYDVSGNELWTRQFGSTGNDGAQGVSVDTSGVYVSGWTYGTLPSQTTSGGQDAFVRKYDFAGTELWTRQFGTADGESAHDISVDASGVYVSGFTFGTFPGQTSSGDWDAVVRKYDFSGNEVWTHQFGSTNADRAYGISIDASGAYVTGATSGTLPGQTSAGGDDAYVAKLVP